MATFWNFTEMGDHDYPQLTGTLFLRNSLTALCEQTRHNSSYLNSLKKQTTMIKPIESIFISNKIISVLLLKEEVHPQN